MGISVAVDLEFMFLRRFWQVLSHSLLRYLGLAVWSMAIASGLVISFPHSPPIAQVADPRTIGRETYLEICASCHIPVPAEVLPTETWKEILTTTNKHYGIAIEPPPISLSVRLAWDYLQFASRPLLKDEPRPILVERSRYFKVLHPQVDLPEIVSLKTCIVCHPSAQAFDYRQLSPQWEAAYPKAP
jgi:hypothetical protein